MRCCATSRRTSSAKWTFTSERGTWPFRKPGSRACFCTRSYARSHSLVTTSAGASTTRRRLQLSISSTATFIEASSGARGGSRTPMVVHHWILSRGLLRATAYHSRFRRIRAGGYPEGIDAATAGIRWAGDTERAQMNVTDLAREAALRYVAMVPIRAIITEHVAKAVDEKGAAVPPEQRETVIQRFTDRFVDIFVRIFVSQA